MTEKRRLLCKSALLREANAWSRCERNKMWEGSLGESIQSAGLQDAKESAENGMVIDVLALAAGRCGRSAFGGAADATNA